MNPETVAFWSEAAKGHQRSGDRLTSRINTTIAFLGQQAIYYILSLSQQAS